ncbi:hypothetical protein SAMN05421747_103125 [Parapedobacter composti]|uniref:Uncharacterized protein n=1 Tax=Parapedobacter composti TaxID=623281 RepID=A0A1I1FSZ4_9SPHI|nr:hypothetical protein [Parapedobacter composti]SFC02126.1 hypothetical protein SAMN05421747_103125 [Parapedobacter composti]
MKRDKEDKFDRQLREKFDGFTPEVPPGLWGKIAEQLGEEKQQPLRGKKRRISTWWMAVAATLVVVCGLTYWFNRPVEVTYLHGGAALPEMEGPKPAPVSEPEKEISPAPEPLDAERVKRLFAKRTDKAGNRLAKITAANTDEGTAARGVAVTASAGSGSAKEEEILPVEQPAGRSARLEEAAVALEEPVLAGVPDIQPPVVLDDVEDTMLAVAPSEKPSFGVSSILNYVVGAVDQREEKLVTFSNDEEGSLKLDFNFSLARNKKKKIK